MEGVIAGQSLHQLQVAWVSEDGEFAMGDHYIAFPPRAYQVSPFALRAQIRNSPREISRMS
jgi:hypothetical protein